MRRSDAAMVALQALAMTLPAPGFAAEPPPAIDTVPIGNLGNLDDLDCAVHAMTALAGGIGRLKDPELKDDKLKQAEKSVSRLQATLAYFVARLEVRSQGAGFKAEIDARYAASRAADVKTQAQRTVECMSRVDRAQIDFLNRAKSK